jgi:threonine synthase
MLHNAWKWSLNGKECTHPSLDFGAQKGTPYWLESNFSEIPVIEETLSGMERYRHLLPLAPTAPLVSLGEPETPVVQIDSNLWMKLEYLMPTGSYKDRGACAVISHALALGATEVLEDSSGNAGSSLAAYAARAGIKANILVPHSIPDAKLKSMQAYGSSPLKLPMNRDEVAQEAKRISGHAYFASHTWNPVFFHGTKTFLWELWLQYRKKQVDWPQHFIFPTGNGTLLLGTWLGLQELKLAGKLPFMPRISAVQAQGFEGLSKSHFEFPATSTRADGIAIRNPLRKHEILRAIEHSGGQLFVVSEKEIEVARNKLASMGWLVEYASATAYAVLQRTMRKQEKILIPLTGNGLKNPS